MAIEVIGAGFGRTGTMSLKIALENTESISAHLTQYGRKEVTVALAGQMFRDGPAIRTESRQCEVEEAAREAGLKF